MILPVAIHCNTPQTFAQILKFNPYHDRHGRFASANSYATFTYIPGKSKAHDLAIAREKERHASIGDRDKKETHYRKLNTEEEFDEFASHYQKFEGELTAKEKRVIGRYQTESFAFNQKLRGADPADYDEEVFGKQATKQEYRTLDAALEKSTIHENITVYRAIADTEALGDLSVIRGKIITDNGYASTSLNRKAAEMYGNGIICKINIPKGSKGAYISGIKDDLGNDFKSNREILLPRNSAYRISSVKEINSSKRSLFQEKHYEVEMDYVSE